MFLLKINKSIPKRLTYISHDPNTRDIVLNYDILLEVLPRAPSASIVNFSQLWSPRWKPGFTGALASHSQEYLFVQLPTAQRRPLLHTPPDSSSPGLRPTSREHVDLCSANYSTSYLPFLFFFFFFFFFFWFLCRVWLFTQYFWPT